MRLLFTPIEGELVGGKLKTNQLLRGGGGAGGGGGGGGGGLAVKGLSLQ